MECVKKVTDEIEEINNGNVEALIRTLNVKINAEDADSLDSTTLYRMCAALVNINDPERNRLCSKYTIQNSKTMNTYLSQLGAI
jgi:hypothetical protein